MAPPLSRVALLQFPSHQRLVFISPYKFNKNRFCLVQFESHNHFHNPVKTCKILTFLPSSLRLSKFSTSMASFQRSAVFSLVLIMSLLWGFSQAKDVLVGGKTDAWKIPSSESDSLNKWAGNARFLIGDSLVWKYDGQKDSVLQVNKEAYAACNTTNPIEEYKDGNTKVKLDRSGPFYFISGAEGHCEKGQKIVVVVLSQKHTRVGAPAPSPVEFQAPAVAPTSGASTLKGGLMVALVGVLVLGLF